MIGKLTGIVEEKEIGRILLDVAGVGYELAVPESTLQKAPGVGKRCSLLVHTHVREDAIVLFGFANKDEKELFQTVLSVSGVGPKLALAILSDLSPESFKRAVVNQDIKQLSKVSGVGKRTAERLALELKDKFRIVPEEGGEPLHSADETSSSAYAEALAALQALGYTLDEAERAVAKASQRLADTSTSQLSTEVLVSQALRMMT